MSLVLTTTLTTYRPNLSSGAGWRVNGARFFVVDVTRDEREAVGDVFESSDGERFWRYSSGAIRATSGGNGAHLKRGSGSCLLPEEIWWTTRGSNS
jgi:hypothetical protein